MGKAKHIPIRTCVACRTTDAKRGLLRVVRLPEGTVCYDPKGKMAGRGAYVCARPECIALARKQKKLERSLKVTSISEALFTELGNRTVTPSGAFEAGAGTQRIVEPEPGKEFEPTAHTEELEPLLENPLEMPMEEPGRASGPPAEIL